MNQNQSQSSNMGKQSYEFSNSIAGGGRFENYSSCQQISYQDSLSRDEDGDDDIKEQIKLAC